LKLRLYQQSLRVRLTQGEVQSLGAGDVLTYRLALGPTPDAGWRFALRAADVSEPCAATEGGALTVQLPRAQALALAQTDLVTLRADLALSGCDPLRFTLEKDFQCLQPRPGDDDHDTFAHPSQGSARC
jgi:hypothetical protein